MSNLNTEYKESSQVITLSSEHSDYTFRYDINNETYYIRIDEVEKNNNSQNFDITQVLSVLNDKPIMINSISYKNYKNQLKSLLDQCSVWIEMHQLIIFFFEEQLTFPKEVIGVFLNYFKQYDIHHTNILPKSNFLLNQSYKNRASLNKNRYCFVVYQEKKLNKCDLFFYGEPENKSVMIDQLISYFKEALIEIMIQNRRKKK